MATNTGRKKIALIGSGMIGGTLAHLAAKKEMGDVVLFDIAEGMPQGKALDLQPVRPDRRLRREDHRHQRLCRHRRRGRDHRHRRRAAQAGHEPRRPARHQPQGDEGGRRRHQEQRPDAFVICITNPLDAMVWALREFSGLPHNKVVGMAGVLDSARFATFLAWEFGVSVKDVNAFVLGGHGDTMVPGASATPRSTASRSTTSPRSRASTGAASTKSSSAPASGGGEIVGLLEQRLAPITPPPPARSRWPKPISATRSASCPAPRYLEGKYGVDGLYVGVPAVIGARTASRDVIEID